MSFFLRCHVSSLQVLVESSTVLAGFRTLLTDIPKIMVFLVHESRPQVLTRSLGDIGVMSVLFVDRIVLSLFVPARSPTPRAERVLPSVIRSYAEVARAFLVLTRRCIPSIGSACSVHFRHWVEGAACRCVSFSSESIREQRQRFSDSLFSVTRPISMAHLDFRSFGGRAN